MSRFVFLLVAASFFLFFWNKLDSFHQRLTQPEPPPKKWPQPLQKIANEVVKAYPRNTVQAHEALKLFQKNDAIFIDVRSKKEQAVSSIPRAIKVQPGKINTQVAPWKDLGGEKVLIVYCTVGMRSGELKNQLREKGWASFNLIGGLCAWAWEEGPLVDTQGNETKLVHTYSEEYADCLPENYKVHTN